MKEGNRKVEDAVANLGKEIKTAGGSLQYRATTPTTTATG